MKKNSSLRPVTFFIGLVLAVLLLSGVSGRAGVVYSDITTFSGQGYAGGGATNMAGTIFTNMVADDLNLASGTGGQPITSITFSVANFNTSIVSASALVRFYANDGSGGGPGTLLAALNFNPIAFNAGPVVQTFTFTPGTTIFTAPLNGVVWAGIAFSSTTATLAQMNNLGQGLFDPPTVGSSADAFFQSSAAGSFTSNNPGGVFQFFGGNPKANFGWQLSNNITAPVPESGNAALLLMLGLAGLWAAHLRLRRCASY